jgi:predicted dehydrogenase
MTTRPTALRAGVIGAGLMGRWHAHAIRHVGGRVVAVVDQDLARAGALAARLPERPLADTDVGRVLREHRIDVLHVCTPVATHDAIAQQAIEAGVPVLVEKPVAPDLASVERLHGLAQARGVLLCPVYQFLFQPGVLAAERALPRLGPVRHLDLVVCSAGAEGGTAAERESVALDILPHGLALARRLIGPSVATAEWIVGGGPPGELRAVADAGETSVVLGVSMHARPTENSLTVRCDRGTIRANLFHGFAIVERGAPSRLDKIGRPIVGSAQALGAAIGNLTGRAVRGELAYPGLRELVRRFHAACAAGGSSPVSVEESIDVARGRDSIAAKRAGVKS